MAAISNKNFAGASCPVIACSMTAFVILLAPDFTILAMSFRTSSGFACFFVLGVFLVLLCFAATGGAFFPLAFLLSLLVEILLDVGLMGRLDSDRKNSCQGGKSDRIPASDCDNGKYKV